SMLLAVSPAVNWVLSSNVCQFPHGNITVKDGVMTIHGMTSGDYVSHKMSITEPPVTPDGRVLHSEVELRYKDGNVQEDFTKKYGIASVSEGDPFDKGFMHQLSSCRLL
ncbi:hypothetical protein AAAA28_20515, partial [Providencia stuartii]|uniref:hypothetical protein n=1 Tax=Providencia stuartii TaxID=588 RepID=UPI0030EFAD1C